MSNVVTLNAPTKLDIPVDRVLDGAKDADLDGLFIVGRTKDGELYFASSIADGGDVLWLWEIAKSRLMEAVG